MIILNSDNETVGEDFFTTDAVNLKEVLFEYECHCMSAYLDELTEDEDNTELSEELTRIHNNINLSTTIIGNQAFRLCDDETGWVVARLVK